MEGKNDILLKRGISESHFDRQSPKKCSCTNEKKIVCGVICVYAECAFGVRNNYNVM